ncbi:ankyrin repeat domain-containing protein 54-like [Mucor ambiguus]|uniref:Ankyrin repeat domain-containing protein 54-like n=1 Tax=Mucor ambiguus TaxID=91626 RepID=A0A0C9N8L9_9FUNG|nr:ankyrin repeat domain-containing protein 54-like [Mucor ambiguus]
MSSKTPNDILMKKDTHSSKGRISKRNTQPTRTSTRLRDVFINSAQREELMTACSKGDVARVSHLLQEKKAGINPDLIRDSKLRTPLLIACAGGHAAVVRQLVRFGANVNNPMGDIVGNKPLDLAVISNDVDTVLAVLEAGAKVASHDSSQQNGMADDGLPLELRRRAATRTPLDLANSRLELLIQQSESKGTIKSNTMDQVKQIIKLLTHFLPPTSVDELNELTDKLSSINIASEDTSEDGQCTQQKNSESMFVMKSLRDVISKIQV